MEKKKKKIKNFVGHPPPPPPPIWYSETWELGTPKGLWKTVLHSGVVLFPRSMYMYWIGLGTEVAALNSQVVPISQVVLKTGFSVYTFRGVVWNFYSHTVPC